QGDAGGLAMRALQKEIPIAAGWSRARRARWSEACDASARRMSVAAGVAQIAAVRALGATSAWSALWDAARAEPPEGWARAREWARSTGRDAAMVVAWRAAWEATPAAGENSDVWSGAMAAAKRAVHQGVDELQQSGVELFGALVVAGRP